MKNPQWRVLVPVIAADWLAGDPAAAAHFAALADHAADTGQVRELVEAVLNCISTAVGGKDNIHGARRRLEDRALTIAEVSRQKKGTAP